MGLFVEIIPQDKSNACWLASSTMMRSWKNSRSYPISDTLMLLDGTWGNFYELYNADKALPFAYNEKLVQTLGLTSLPPASYTIDYFFSLLDVSPIMAVIMFSQGANVGHMVVITGISGDKTPDGTMLQVNDPLPLNQGHTYSISFSDFLAKFESVVAYENNFPDYDLTSQLFYYAQVYDPFKEYSDAPASSEPDDTNTTPA